MIISSFLANGNELKAPSNLTLTSGGNYNDKFHFLFDNQWAGYSKTVIFSMANGEEISVPIENDYAFLPNEVIRSAGLVKIGLVGINSSGSIISTNFVGIRVYTGANETETMPVAMADNMRAVSGEA